MPVKPVSENILLVVSGFGMLQGIFSAALLYFHPKSDRTVNRFLALYVLTLVFPISASLAQHVFSWQAVTLIEPFITLIAPFLYLYVCSFKETITWKKAWPHFILFIISIPLAIWVHVSIGSRYPAEERVPAEAKKQILLLVPFSMRLVQRIVYYILSLRALRSYQRSIVNLYSDTSRINLNWITWLINGFLFILFTSIATYSLLIWAPAYFDWWILISAVIVAIYICMALFKGIGQESLWQVNKGVSKEQLEEELHTAGQIDKPETITEKLSEQKNRLLNTKTELIASQVLDSMEKERIYQEPNLTLQHLADKLQVPSYQVSQAINEGIQKSFYDLVNGYRVEEAKRLLLDPQSVNYTILSVGFEAGFNSKTTFNTVFKKFTGYTPSEYRERATLKPA